MKNRVFIMTGEVSGDLHASRLVRSLKALDNSIDFYGVGGCEMEREGVSLLYNISQFEAFGIVQPILNLRFYKNALNSIRRFIQEKSIDTVILTDFPGFNMMLASRLKKDNVKVIYYISPQIWAWRYSRIKKIKKYIDAMIVLYPFEETLYRKEEVRAFFEGNPLVDIVDERLRENNDIDEKISSPCICLLPGSRISEIKRHLPPMMQAAEILKERYNASFIIPVLSGKNERYIIEKLKKINNQKIDPHIVVDNACKAMEKSDILILSSGTATLEAAIIGKPMIVIYRIGLFNEMLARLLIKVDKISLVNIIAGKEVCPELLQREVNAKRIFYEVAKLLDNRNLYDDMIKNIKSTTDKLSGSGAIDKIAKKVLSLIYEKL